MIANKTTRWINVIDYVICNYNHRVHRTLGKAYADMTMGDVLELNQKLKQQNKVSILKLNQYNVGDKVRYLIKKNVFDKGSKKFSSDIWTVTAIRGYNIQIELADQIQFKKYWELKKV